VDLLGLVARLALGAVFLASGGRKLSDRPAWARQAGDLAVPATISSVLPWVELVLGAALVAGVAEPWPAVIALVVLMAFTAFLVRRLADGARPPCACFGARSNRPLGAGHLVRNAGFIALAVVAVVTT
jgi:uncharacterized membrane protein YphA (DoxX/SURF4 family)